MPDHTNTKVKSIKVRMYKTGTGDFFLLQFKKTKNSHFCMLIDCGSIYGSKEDLAPAMEDLAKVTKGTIDLMVVTHEHADHMNGFEKCAAEFKKIDVKKLWLAWTESDTTYANEFRKKYSEVKLALHKATDQLKKFSEDGSIQNLYEKEYMGKLMMDANTFFIDSLVELNQLNGMDNTLSLDDIPTMVDKLKSYNVINDKTVVSFFEPGQLVENLENLVGIRFYILGPPLSNTSIRKKEVKGEGYEKRETKSYIDRAFLNVFDQTASDPEVHNPFDAKYESLENHPELDKRTATLESMYRNESWRTIDHEWLLSAGNLALRHQTSINNTSLVIAIQIIDSEKILLFPGDAEHGSWLSWHDGLEWSIKDKNDNIQKVNAEYILNHTVFYKVSHHLSQNGTPSQKGLEMMTQDDLTAMVTLDLNSILPKWRNTMPNDLIGEILIEKTKGNVFFAGDRTRILNNLKTDRVTISQGLIDKVHKNHEQFDDKVYVECEIL